MTYPAESEGHLLQRSVPDSGAGRVGAPSADARIDESGQSVATLFERQALSCPQRVALKSSDASITYAALDRAANRLARRLVDLTGTGNDPVAALFTGGVGPLVAMMAALKAGKIYVPLDASYPPSRLEYMLADTGAPVIVTGRAHLDLASRLGGSRMIMDAANPGHGVPDTPLGLDVPPDALASIIYTSGTTGEPKGVTHAQRVLIHWAAKYRNMTNLAGDDCILSFFSFAFAATIKINLAAMLHGASVVVGALESLDHMGDIIDRDGVTIANVSPTVLSHFLGTLKEPRAFPRLRLFYISGEPLKKPEALRFRKKFPDGVTLLNVLASTEAGAARAFAVAGAASLDGDAVPVGYPVGDAEVILFDDDLTPAKPGEAGQIGVRSSYLAGGYWQKPEATARAFLDDPGGGRRRIYLTGDVGRILDDGCLIHLGRKDSQVKLRAYRIETGDVEAALRLHPDVRDAVVILREDRPGDQRLTAYVVPADGAPPGIAELRRFLRSRVPDYMVPSAYLVLPALPMTPNGKVDRAALPAPGRVRPALATPFVAVRTPIEERLAAIFAGVLDLDAVGADDNFMELGGHSLLAAQVVSRVNDAYHVNLPLTAIFEAPTVAGLAILVIENFLASMEGHTLESILDESSG